MKIWSIKNCLMVLVLCLCASVDTVAQSKAPLIVDTELPFRCRRPADDKEVSNTIVLKQGDFTFMPGDGSDPLPRYAVNKYNFENKALDVVLTELLQSADISVQAETGSYPLMNGKNVKGELSAIIKELTEKAGVFYTYHDNTKTLHLVRRTDVILQSPRDETVLMALLDALRGAEIKRLNIDWDKYQIHLNVSPYELDKAKMLMAQILSDSYLLMAETKLYRIDPANTYLQQALSSFGMSKISMLKNGVVGQSIVLKDRANVDDFVNAIRPVANVNLLAQGMAVVPNGWNMRFNLGECSSGVLPYKDFAMLMRTRIQKEDDIQTRLTLLSAWGEIAVFDLLTSLNQEVALIGVPTGDNQGEFVFTVRLNLIRFIKKGEKS